MPTDDTTPRPRPVTITRADGEAEVVGHRLAALHPGPSIDLDHEPVPVLAEDIRQVAEEVAAEQLDTAVGDHERRAAELLAAAEGAEAEHRAADAELEARQAEQRRLVDGAAWCDERSGAIEGLLREVVVAEDAEAHAQDRLAAADAKVAAVTEQRAAAEGVLGAARRQLAELEVSGQGENDVRRSLERAGQVARDAEAAAATGREEAERGAVELVAAEEQLAAAEEALAVVMAVADGDHDGVVAALDRFVAAPVIAASPDDVALAEAIEELEAVTARADPDELRDAEVAVVEARTALDALVRPPDRALPDWWEQLTRLHNAVVDAESAAHGNFARKSTTRRLEAALAAERALLVEIGYPTHLDAIMSGGRPPTERRDPAAFRNAAQVLDQAEANLASQREREQAVVELGHLRRLAAGRLDRPAETLTPADLRSSRRDPAPAAALAAAMGVVDVPERQLAALARAWLAEYDGLAVGLAAAEARRQAASRSVADARAALADAQAALEAADTQARDARRQVAILEAELGNRVVPVADPTTRAATAAALRDRIGALEARVTSAEAEAVDERSAAATALAAASATLAAAHRAVSDLTAHLVGVANLVEDPLPRTADLAAELTAVAAALRAAADDVVTTAPAAAAAEAGAAAIAARSALDRHLGTEPGAVGSGALAEAVARLLAPDHRTSDVVIEPLGAGEDEAARAAILEAVIAAGRRRGLVVVTDDPWLLGWAIELEPEVGELVPLAALQSDPIPAEETGDAAPVAHRSKTARQAR